MVCQKSRDRQQGPQKQRSLPPKKRTIPESSASKYCSSQILPSIISSANAAASGSSKYRSAQVAAPISADDRSTSNSSSASQTSFGSSIALSSSNNYIIDATVQSALAPTTETASPATNSKTMKASESRGASGVMPFISNDSKFVASTLKRRESLELYRAAKAMLYDAYMKAVNEESR